MKKTVFKLSVILFGILTMSLSLTANKENAINLCQLANVALTQAETAATGTGDCGTGYAYFCGYFHGIDHPDFYAYEGPWLA